MFTKEQIAGMVRDACTVERTLKEVGSPMTSPVADVCIHVKALAAALEELHEAFSGFISVVACTKKKNTPEFMEYLAEHINKALKVCDVDGGVEWPGSWSNEFHYIIGNEPMKDSTER